MIRLAALLVALGADGGRPVKYEIDPCSILGNGDGGVGGLECMEPTRTGWIDRVFWNDGRRELREWTRLSDGGVSMTRTPFAPDASW